MPTKLTFADSQQSGSDLNERRFRNGLLDLFSARMAVRFLASLDAHGLSQRKLFGILLVSRRNIVHRHRTSFEHFDPIFFLINPPLSVSSLFAGNRAVAAVAALWLESSAALLAFTFGSAPGSKLFGSFAVESSAALRRK